MVILLLVVSFCGASARLLCAQDRIPAGMERVLELHAGSSGWRSFRMEGTDWPYPEEAIGTEAIAADDPHRTVAFGESVRFGFAGFAPAAAVMLRVAFLSDSQERAVQVVVDGEIARERLALPFGKLIRVDLPVAAAALGDGRVELEVRRLAGPNAVVAGVEVWSDRPAELTPIPKEPVRPVDLPRPRLTPRPARVAGGEALTMDLGGTWSFHPSPPADFARVEGATREGWTTIEVPGEWALQGFDLPAERTVAYRRAFDIPPDWAGRRIVLRCDSVYGRAVLFVDGKEAAVSERTFTPFEVDLTDFVTPGARHVLAWAVTTDCLADALTYGTGYARHPLGGILRRMTLFAVPAVHVTRFHVETPLDEDYDDATLRILLTLANESGGACPPLDVAVRLSAPDGTPVALAPGSFSLPAPAAGTTRDHVLAIPVSSPAKWHPEHPALHALTLTLALDGAPLETLEKRVGFRQVEVWGTQLLVNGRRTKLRGINRHEAHPRYGRSLREPLWHRDAELLRDANVNFVRTSHYPPDERFLDACDELGLFVEVESPLCWIGHGASSHWKEWDYRSERYLPYLTRCALETIERDRSHPCVILWSLGNESLWSRNWERVAATAKRADPTRPFVFHDQAWGGFNNQGSDLPIANIHYPGPEGPERVARGFDRPVLFGEYCHLNVYNRGELLTDPGLRDTWGEALAPMWEKMFASEVVIGGAIWSGISDRFFVGEREVGYGSWGPIDGWRREKPEYWHVFKCYSPLRVRAPQIAHEGSAGPPAPIVLEVENRMEWTDVGELGIAAVLTDDDGRPLPGPAARVEASGAPGATGTVTVRLPALPESSRGLLLTFRAPATGRLLDAYRFPLGEEEAPRPPARAGAPAPGLTEYEDRFEIACGELIWTLDRRTGLVSCAGDAPLVVSGPFLHAAPLEHRYTLWIEDFTPGPATPPPFYTHWTLERLEVERGERFVTATAHGSYAQAEGWFSMEFDRDGALELTYEFTHRGEDVDAQELGVVFALSPDLDHQRWWKREAQWSAYPPGHLGARTGTASLTRGDDPWPAVGPREAPPWPWNLDQTAGGTNAFRATKRHLSRLTLTGAPGGVEVRSDGTQSARAWGSGDVIELLIAEFTGPGSENFLGAHWASRRRQLAAGDTLAGRVFLRPTMRR